MNAINSTNCMVNMENLDLEDYLRPYPSLWNEEIREELYHIELKDEENLTRSLPIIL